MASTKQSERKTLCGYETNIYKIDDIDVDISRIIGTLVNVVTNRKLNFVKIIGQGSYGQILLYQENETKEQVVLKQTKSIQEWVNLTELRTTRCDQVDAIPLIAMIIKKTTWYFILMPFYDGNLDIIISSKKLHKVKFIFSLLQSITQQVLCLYKHGFYYTDMKLENILFQCHGNTFSILLGDLGSIVKKNQNGVATYPPWIHYGQNGKVTGSDQSVVWGLCILILHFFLDKQLIYKYFGWKADDNNKRYKLIDQIEYKPIVTLLKDAMITSSDEKGLSVEQFCDRINFMNE